MDKKIEAGSVFWVEEINGIDYTQMRIKRKVRPLKKEFNGWGSKQLFDFLHSIGKDINQKFSQYDVSGIINDYVNKNNLSDPTKKKKIRCDEKLYLLFGKKTISRNKIYEILEAHFAENCLESEEDSLISSEDEDNALRTIGKMKSAEKKPLPKKKVRENPTSCFAAIKPSNIKLIYLKWSLVQQLLKDPESFESKVVGSFVRIKCDPNDYLQKNSHQLLQVTGVKKGSAKEHMDSDVCLQVSNLFKEISISILSDNNFSEVECDDLHQRVKDGLLKRPTVVEMQDKVRILHEDVTKHWLDEELVLLQNLIDRANEKGWRRELDEYLDRRQLLQNPDEQARLLREVPEVIPEDLEPECQLEVLDTPEEAKDLQNMIEIPVKHEEMWYVAPEVFDDAATRVVTQNTSDTIIEESGLLSRSSEFPVANVPTNVPIRWAPDGIDHAGHIFEAPLLHKPIQFMDSNIIEGMGFPKEEEKVCQEKVNKEVPPSEVIELSDDDEREEPICGKHIPEESASPLDRLMWYYEDPQANVQGPFSVVDLKRWSDAQYFPPDFKLYLDMNLDGPLSAHPKRQNEMDQDTPQSGPLDSALPTNQLVYSRRKKRGVEGEKGE